MKNPLLVVIGAVAALLGVLFTFQGLGYVHGSPMTGSHFWAVVGPMTVVAGVYVVITGWRGRGWPPRR